MEGDMQDKLEQPQLEDTQIVHAAPGEMVVPPVISNTTQQLINRDMQLWIIQDEYAEILAALTTEIMIYPKKKTCRIVTLGGTELDEWVEGLLQVIETWAIDNGCEAMETACRKGFIKKIKKYGYEHTYTILGKELTTLH